jgi:hypothetical protein
MKVDRLIKMFLNEMCSNVRIGKNLSNSFAIQNGIMQGDALSPLLFNFGPGKLGGAEVKWDISAVGLC